MFDPSQFAGLPLNIMALMPVLVHHFDQPTEFCVKVVSEIQQVYIAAYSNQVHQEEGVGGGRFVEQFWPDNKHNSDRKYFNYWYVCIGMGEKGEGEDGWMRGAPLPFIS